MNSQWVVTMLRRRTVTEACSAAPGVAHWHQLSNVKKNRLRHLMNGTDTFQLGGGALGALGTLVDTLKFRATTMVRIKIIALLLLLLLRFFFLGGAGLVGVRNYSLRWRGGDIL